MKNNQKEVKNMTNKQTKALLEAIKIIVENAKDTEEIKKALERIQSSLEPTK
jgi:hypothetical protein